MPPSTAPPVDVDGRPLALRPVDLDRFFRPRGVAVVGASSTPGKTNTTMWRSLLAWGERTGVPVLPVHPAHASIDGIPCVASVDLLAAPVDLAAVLVADAPAVLPSIQAAAIPFAVLFGAGYAEVGAEGVDRQRRLEELVAQGPTRVLGPNTNLNAFEHFRDDLPGPAIALITQSGHQGRPVFAAQQFGVALSHWAPTGNEADLEFADFAAHFADDPRVGAIAAYIEGFRDGRTLQLAADHAAERRVPIVCVKVGRTAEGRSMATSHTGHLAGADAVVASVFEQYGITRVDGLDELTDTAAMFARTTPPRNWRRRTRPIGVAVYAISGGTGAHMADLLAAGGCSLPDLTPRTQRALRALIPAYLRVSNPVDCGGPPAMDHRGRTIIDTILADPAIDVLVCPITGAVESISRPLARDLVEAAAVSTKPVFVVWGSPDITDPVFTEILVPSRLPTFRTFGNCVTAVKAYADHWAFQARRVSPFRSPRRRSATADDVTAVLDQATAAAGGAVLHEEAALQVLEAAGVPTPRRTLCRTAAASARAATAIGFPVVAKVVSADFVHKSERGLVELDLPSAAAVRRVHDRLVARAAAADPAARVEGVLVEEQRRGGVECVVGISQDPLFGPTVMFGLGGVLVELLGAVAFRVPPFDRDEALRMVRSVRGAEVLEGHRGAPPCDLDALIDVLLRVQDLALDHEGRIDELDINPLLVGPSGVVALDAVIVTSTPPDSAGTSP
jgi:acyl-CoA synthetase (NDP forming)